MERHRESIKSWQDCYKKQRRFLISYAFRMTGSLMDAEDIVQETVSECLSQDFDNVRNHPAWMTRICSNKVLDLLKSAHKKRNEYIGTWLPEMIPETIQSRFILQDEEHKLEQAESLTISFLILLQTLTPTERAVFLLKDVFGYSFKEISELLEKSTVACRKIAERARVSVREKKYKFPKPSPNAAQLINQFFDAIKSGDRSSLKRLLSEKSEFMSDGGGKVSAAPILETKSEILDFFLSLHNSPIFAPNYQLQTIWVNSRPGLIISKLTSADNWKVETIMSFEIEEEQIVRVFAQRNPEKLEILNSNI